MQWDVTDPTLLINILATEHTAMNTATEPSFLTHLLSTDKREWSITVAGVPFVIVRSTPESGDTFYSRRHVVEVWDTWTLFVVTTDGAREFVTQRTGMVVTRRADEPSRVDSVARDSLAHLTQAARTFVEALARLTVMTDALMGNVDDKAPLKIRKLRQAAVVELSKRRVLTQMRNNTVALVCGDAVLIVSKHYSKNEWTELVYRVGDRAVYDSFNLSYTGTITSISSKTITVVSEHSNRTKQMKHDRFVSYNNRPIADADKRNAEWMD